MTKELSRRIAEMDPKQPFVWRLGITSAEFAALEAAVAAKKATNRFTPNANMPVNVIPFDLNTTGGVKSYKMTTASNPSCVLGAVQPRHGRREDPLLQRGRRLRLLPLPVVRTRRRRATALAWIAEEETSCKAYNGQGNKV